MKKKIIITIITVAVMTGSFLLGTTQAKTKEVEKVVETIPAGYIDTTSNEFYDNYIDMRQVTDFSVNEYGLQLYMSDGSGYWYEK